MTQSGVGPPHAAVSTAQIARNLLVPRCIRRRAAHLASLQSLAATALGHDCDNAASGSQRRLHGSIRDTQRDPGTEPSQPSSGQAHSSSGSRASGSQQPGSKEVADSWTGRQQAGGKRARSGPPLPPFPPQPGPSYRDPRYLMSLISHSSSVRELGQVMTYHLAWQQQLHTAGSSWEGWGAAQQAGQQAAGTSSEPPSSLTSGQPAAQLHVPATPHLPAPPQPRAPGLVDGVHLSSALHRLAKLADPGAREGGPARPAAAAAAAAAADRSGGRPWACSPTLPTLPALPLEPFSDSLGQQPPGELRARQRRADAYTVRVTNSAVSPSSSSSSSPLSLAESGSRAGGSRGVGVAASKEVRQLAGQLLFASSDHLQVTKSSHPFNKSQPLCKGHLRVGRPGVADFRLRPRH
ncbi:hypothetical protein V8C86DRAFT_2863685 [Haematococcus lacustris]